MRLNDQYYKPESIDCYTFVFDEVTPETGYNTMLAMSEDGYAFSQWTSGIYDPNGENEHLGNRILLSAIGAAALDSFFSRLSIPDEWEALHDTIEQVIGEEKDE
jgi:hypothetical protein